MLIQTKIRATVAAALLLLVSGCTSLHEDVVAVRSKAEQKATVEMERAEQAAPVITSTSEAWLMGEAVEIEAPQSPILDNVVTYHPSQSVTLIDVAEYVQQISGIKVETIDLQGAGTAGQASAAASSRSPSTILPGQPPSANQDQGGAQARENPAQKRFALSYQGKLSGLLDLATSKAGVWWKLEQGRLRYYQTETKTFYLPATARVSTGNAQISANTGADQGGGGQGGAGQGGGQGSGNQSSSMAGGTNSSSSYSVDKWKDIKEAATVIGGGATIAVNPGLGSISVTGTPNQVRHVEDWVKSLTDSLSQMVAITVRMYSVKLNSQDNYGWSPDVVFKGLKTQYGFNLTGQQPISVGAGNSAFNFTANVLSTATGAKSQYVGSQLAVQALSEMGEVSEVLNRTIVTMNGEPAPLQIANQKGYIASQTAPQAVPTGTVPPAPTLTTATITSGFTALFLPRVANGKIWMAMNITDSKLLSLDKAGGEGSLLQSPNLDLQTLQNSVRLTPGDALLLTGHQQENGSSNDKGTGSPSNWLFGGGVGRSAGRQMIAIVISAKVL